MTDKRILFSDFEFPRTNGLKYLLNEEKYHFSVRLLLDGGEDVCPFEQTGY